MSSVWFDNQFIAQLPGVDDGDPRPRQLPGVAWASALPTPVAAPELLAHTPELADALGFPAEVVASPGFAEVFGGCALYAGMQPWAANYGGHQFGHWAGQLGDGRAISLGELVGADGQRHELQLKGAGPTPFSRGADGRAVLRSSIREFLCSEAMHHLGIPTTRALSLVASGEGVVRDMFYDGHPRAEPGALVCRVAPSFLRFGSFELPAARGETALLRQLADFCIARDFPWLSGHGDALYAAWFGEIAERTAVMVAHWMRVGFVHGVMNTDTMSILGLTIDYGPYGWVEDYDPWWTPNTTDAQGRRYRFGAQPQVAYWNLGRLAQALAPLFDDTTGLSAGLARYRQAYAREHAANAAAKLGLEAGHDDDVALYEALLALMAQARIDMTLGFLALADVGPGAAPDPQALAALSYAPDAVAGHLPAIGHWLQRYAARLAGSALSPAQRQARMAAANPRYVLRNWLAQQAIEQAEGGDLDGVHALARVLRQPYTAQAGGEAFARMRPDWAVGRPGCAMLSCSS